MLNSLIGFGLHRIATKYLIQSENVEYSHSTINCHSTGFWSTSFYEPDAFSVAKSTASSFASSSYSFT